MSFLKNSAPEAFPAGGTYHKVTINEYFFAFIVYHLAIIFNSNSSFFVCMYLLCAPQRILMLIVLLSCSRPSTRSRVWLTLLLGTFSFLSLAFTAHFFRLAYFSHFRPNPNNSLLPLHATFPPLVFRALALIVAWALIMAWMNLVYPSLPASIVAPSSMFRLKPLSVSSCKNSRLSRPPVECK